MVALVERWPSTPTGFRSTLASWVLRLRLPARVLRLCSRSSEGTSRSAEPRRPANALLLWGVACHSHPSLGHRSVFRGSCGMGLDMAAARASTHLLLAMCAATSLGLSCWNPCYSGMKVNGSEKQAGPNSALSWVPARGGTGPRRLPPSPLLASLSRRNSSQPRCRMHAARLLLSMPWSATQKAVLCMMQLRQFLLLRCCDLAACRRLGLSSWVALRPHWVTQLRPLVWQPC
mmetsp:Transcript_100855/g.323680  ORF Transcript_100855/g.323680 Transcript_100855/m.323680 type:complete len:232 (+) Transcript_100855:604-1299(+)